MVGSQHLRRWWALVVAAGLGAAVLAYVSGGLMVLLGHWRLAPRTALLALPVFVALALWPAGRLAPGVTRTTRAWGWVIAFAVACALFGWMTIESRAMARA